MTRQPDPAPTRILLADDEDTFLLSTAEVLRQEGFVVETARNGTEVLDALRAQEPFDLLLVDINMPGNVNLELLQEVKKSFPLLPIVIVTGFPSVATAVTALRLAVVDYLTKPFEMVQLFETVRRAIARGRSARAVASVRRDVSSWVGMLQNFEGALAEGLVGETGDNGNVRRSRDPDLQKLGANLSVREREILDAMGRGQRVAAIARALQISPHTVRNHLKSIFRKLEVHSQVELLGRLR
jgi:DNA-binding NarL/FixJ family response regulator